jgi:hypothetical protein
MHYFLLNTLQLMAQNVKSSRNPIIRLTHHGVVKLLVVNDLSCSSQTWEEFPQRPQVAKEEHIVEEVHVEEEHVA